MMQDQHSNTLQSFYQEALAKTYAYIESYYRIENSLRGDKDATHISELNPGSTIWRIEAPGKERSFTFFIAIPPIFPDILPKFYLTEKDFLSFGRIPHVDKNRFVCTRDPAVIVLNDSKPGEAIQELLQIAISILEAGIRGEMKQDFEEEFLAYWNDEEGPRALLICTPTNFPCKFILYTLSKPLFGAFYLITPSKSFAKSWLNRLSETNSLSDEKEVLCLPLPKVPAFLPTNNQDIQIIFKSLDSISRQAVNNFRGNIILASITRGSADMLFAWRHPLVRVKGFRPKEGVIPLNLSLQGSRDEKITKFNIKRLDRHRIIRRAVDMGVLKEKATGCVIVGCGSVGSTLTMLLAKSGCQKFTLIDPDELKEENVARHLCGLHQVATTKTKVEAVKQSIEKHLPFVNCDIYSKDVLEILIAEPQIFDNAELVVFATANMGAERRANDFFQIENLKPVIYLWLEPYGVAGHVLYVSPRQGGCYRCCFDPNGDFRFAVAEKNKQLPRREVGCQSTFTPYGAADLEMFCSIACKIIIKFLQEPPGQSILFTWIGDKEQFESAGFKISDSYAAHESYCLHQRNILPQPECEICNKPI